MVWSQKYNIFSLLDTRGRWRELWQQILPVIDVSNHSLLDFRGFTYNIENSKYSMFRKYLQVKSKFGFHFLGRWRLGLFSVCLCFIVLVSISSPGDIKLSSLKMRSFCNADSENISDWDTKQLAGLSSGRGPTWFMAAAISCQVSDLPGNFNIGYIKLSWSAYPDHHGGSTLIYYS